MSGQYARLKNALNRAEMTTPGPVQVAVFADDLHEILAHYIKVSTELAELKAASATEACASIPSIAEYIEALEKRIKALEQPQQQEQKTCSVCGGIGGWETSSSATNSFWEECPQCKGCGHATPLENGK